MSFSFKLRKKSQLKVLSAISSNLVVVWIVTMFVTHDLLTLTANLACAILGWYIASKADELSEEL